MIDFDLDTTTEAGFGEGTVDSLQKALYSGTGTDSATLTGGAALRPQDIESSLVNAMAVQQADFKVMNLLNKEKVGTTVHEYTRRNDAGDESQIFVDEGGESDETDQDLERVTKSMKYAQTYREVSLQAQVSKSLEEAVASEKLAGSLVLLKGIEKTFFKGDSSVIPQQFDSIIKQIADGSKDTVIDMAGKKFTDAGGEKYITAAAQAAYDRGGFLTHSFMPSVIAADLQDVIKDRIRFNTKDNSGNVVVETYPTPFSDNIIIAGKEGGPDKMFKVKGPIIANGNASKRPSAPTIKLTPADGSTSLAAGTYYYTVHAVNQYGTSEASAAVSVAVTAGQQVSIVITPGSIKGTGYIICRSKVGGTKTAEMVRCARDTINADTTYVDKNADLPGCGEMLLISHNVIDPTVQWDQFLPMMKFPLFPAKSAIVPFLMILFGTADVKKPWYNAVIKNISFTGNEYA